MTLTSILIWIVLGVIAGWLAGQVMKGSGFGLVGNIIVGIVGSFLGGWIGGELGISGTQTGGLTLASILTATVGAVVLLLYHQFSKKSLGDSTKMRGQFVRSVIPYFVSA